MPTLTKPTPAPAPPPPPETEPTRYRTDPALRRLLTGVVALFVLGCVLYGTLVVLELASRTTETVRTSYPGATALRLDADASDVSVVQGPRGTPVRVEARITRSFTSPERSDRLEGGTLTLASGCSIWLGGSCGVDYEVTVPPGMRVTADIGSGDVTISGVQARGSLVVLGGSGDFALRDVSAASVDVRVGSGDIEITGLRSPLVAAELGSGDLELGVEGPVESVRARAGSGDILLTVPAALGYRLDTDTGSGELTIDGAIVRDDRAPRTLSAFAGSGDVELVARR